MIATLEKDQDSVETKDLPVYQDFLRCRTEHVRMARLLNTNLTDREIDKEHLAAKWDNFARIWRSCTESVFGDRVTSALKYRAEGKGHL